VTTDLSGLHALIVGDAGSFTETLAVGLKTRGATISVIRIDPRESHDQTSDKITNAIDEAEITSGTIDVLVHVLGHVKPGALNGGDPAHKQSSLRILGLMYDVVEEVGRRMIERGAGRIIIVTSVLGLRGVANATFESSISAAAQGFVRSLALEWVRDGIAVNAIAAGVVRDEVEPGDDLEVGAQRYSPARRLTQPEDLVGVVAFLASPLAGFVVGETLIVDDGLSAHA
jgi:NAD(P)-dependent dehydrogenase (short-subunit alcohol dehydrogenase family)